MRMESLKSWLHDNRWLLAAALVVVAGYQIGKDAALRDSVSDSQVVSSVKS